MKTYSEQIMKYCFWLQREAQVSKSFRCMSSQSTHLLTTILSNLYTFHPLDPLKTAGCSNGELFCVFFFSENRCIEVRLLKNSFVLQRQAVFLQSCRPLQQSLTSLHPFGGSKSIVFHSVFHYF